MKKNLNDFKRLLLTACCTLVLSCGWATVNEKPFVIPELKQWSGQRESLPHRANIHLLLL